MTLLQKQDCGGNYGFYRRTKFIELEELQGCKTLGAVLKVDRVGGFLLYEEGAKAYDAAFARCARPGRSCSADLTRRRRSRFRASRIPPRQAISSMSERCRTLASRGYGRRRRFIGREYGPTLTR